LKPENVLIETNARYDDIKVIDFGIAQAYNPGQSVTETIGTPFYIAPEVLHKNYDNQCDIWSLGVILYILLSGIPPFNGNTDAEMMRNIKRGTFDFDHAPFKKVSKDAKDFITELLTYDPKARPTAHEAVKNKWIVKNTTVSEEQEGTNRKNSRVALDNLGGFRADNQMKQACLTFIGS